MLNLKSLTDEILLSETQRLAKEEREIFAQQCEALTQGVFNKNKIIDEMGALTIHG